MGRISQKFVGSLLLGVVGLSGCGSRRSKVDVDTAVPKEVSWAADRGQFQELRKGIDAEQTQTNDELATILSLMADPNEEPGRVRDRFNSMVTKRRSTFNKLIQRERENFNRSEKDKREVFLESLRTERNRYSTKGKSSEENKKFFSELDAKRSRYSSDERDRRYEFDALIREKRSNFDAHMRDVSTRFNDEHRRYSRLHGEYRKAQEQKRRAQDEGRRQRWQGAVDRIPVDAPGSQNSAVSPSGQDDLKKFDQIPPGPGQQLGTED